MSKHSSSKRLKPSSKDIGTELYNRIEDNIKTKRANKLRSVIFKSKEEERTNPEARKLRRLRREEVKTKKAQRTDNKPQTRGFQPGNTLAKAHWFRPGHVPVSPGRPRKSILDQALEDELSRMIKTEHRDTKTGKKIRKKMARIVARQMLKQLIAGKRGIAQLVAERVGGKPLQQIESKIEEVFSDPVQREARIQELLRKASK